MEKRDSGEDIKIGRKQKRRTTSGDRQGNDSQEGRPQTKKPKEEYTDIEFKVDLRDMSIRFEGTRVVNHGRNVPPPQCQCTSRNTPSLVAMYHSLGWCRGEP